MEAADTHEPRPAEGDANDEAGLDAWNRFDEAAALLLADNSTELHRRLVCLPPVRETDDRFLPLNLLQRFHGENPNEVATTALLLATDRRWRKIHSRLINDIAASGVVPEDELLLLAETFLAAGNHVSWEAPADWFSGLEIVLDEGDGSAEDDADDLADDRPVVVPREIRPPLRRWAAEYVARAEPKVWSALVRRAREIDAASGAAIMRGLLDAIDSISPAAQEVVLTAASEWTRGKVREAADAARARLDETDDTDETAAPSADDEPAVGQPSLF